MRFYTQMYVTLYDGNVHPGVNMLLGMGKLVGSNDREAVAAAGKEIQDWAQGASDSIVHLIAEVGPIERYIHVLAMTT